VIFSKVFSVRMLYCKNCSLMGKNFDYGKRESFWYLMKTSLNGDRKINLFSENKPSGGKSDPNMPKSMSI
jgi:hypothetical protein